MSELVETGVRGFQRWCVHHVWWLALVCTLLDLSLLIRDSLDNRPVAWRGFPLFFNLTAAVFFWWVSWRVKKLEATRRLQLEAVGPSAQS